MNEYEPVDEILGAAVRRRVAAVGVAPTFDELHGLEREVGAPDRLWTGRRSVLVAVAVLIAVIAVVVWRPAGDDLATTEFADGPPRTAVEVAETFVRGLIEGGDPDALISLMTPDAAVYTAGTLDTDEGRQAVVGLVEYHRTLGSRLTRLDCEPTDEFPGAMAIPVPAGGEVSAAVCVLAYTNVFYEAAGLESSPEGTMFIRIQDGLMFDGPQGSPPRDDELELHFRAWAHAEVGPAAVGEACPTFFTWRDSACARLILDNLDAWAEAWHADSPH